MGRALAVAWLFSVPWLAHAAATRSELHRFHLPLHDLGEIGVTLGACTLGFEPPRQILEVECRHSLTDPVAAFLLWQPLEGSGRRRLDLGGAASPVRMRLRLSAWETEAIAAGGWRVVVTSAARPTGAAATPEADPVFGDGFETGGVCAAWSDAVSGCFADGVGACSGWTSRSCQGEDWAPCVIEGTPEVCNGIDDDCDGEVDDGLAQECYSGPPGTVGVGICQAGIQTCTAGDWGSCEGEILPSPEICNNLDDDCDGVVDGPGLCPPGQVCAGASGCIPG